MDLKSQVRYIETHIPYTTIVGGLMFRRRQILESANGNYFIIKSTAGFDEFQTLEKATEAIDNNPTAYVVTHKNSVKPATSEQT